MTIGESNGLDSVYKQMDVVRHRLKLVYLIAFGLSNRMQLLFKEFFYLSCQNWFSVLWTPHKEVGDTKEMITKEEISHYEPKRNPLIASRVQSDR
jgi:hypothetical protein